MIKGDPMMPETTMRAIASMIDALSEAIVAGKIKPLNGELRDGVGSRLSQPK